MDINDKNLDGDFNEEFDDEGEFDDDLDEDEFEEYENNEDYKDEDWKARHYKEIEIQVFELKADAIKVEGTDDYYNVFLSLLMAEHESLRNNRHYWVMGLNDEGYILCVYVFSVNPEDLMKISPRAMFRVALFVEATKVILAFNVCNGENLIPTGADVEFFNKAFNSAGLLELEVLDTMVIGEHGRHSDREDGYLKYYREDESFKFVADVKDKLDSQKKKYAVKYAEKRIFLESNKVRQETAIFMLQNAESVDKVMLYTGFNTKEIEDLQNRLDL